MPMTTPYAKQLKAALQRARPGHAAALLQDGVPIESFFEPLDCSDLPAPMPAQRCSFFYALAHAAHSDRHVSRRGVPDPRRIERGEGFARDLDVLASQVQDGSLLNLADEAGNTALSHYLMAGTEAGLKRLLSLPGIDPNILSVDGWSALTMAGRFGFKEAVIPLLQAGATVPGNLPDGYPKPLNVAVTKGWPDEVAALISAGHEPDARTVQAGMKALDAAWRAGDQEKTVGCKAILHRLLEALPDVGVTDLLCGALMRGHWARAEVLASWAERPLNDADFTLWLGRGVPELTLDRLDKMIALGAPPGALLRALCGLYEPRQGVYDSAHKWSLLSHLVNVHGAALQGPEGLERACYWKAPAKVLALLAECAGAGTINQSAPSGEPPLLSLLRGDCPPTPAKIRALLDAGADPNVVNRYNESALELAGNWRIKWRRRGALTERQFRDIETTVSLLQEYGATPPRHEENYHGPTP